MTDVAISCGEPVTMYVLEIKEKTIEANQAVRELALEKGPVVELESKAAAEELAAELSENGERVRVQKAAPSDTSTVDGYLVRFPRRFTHRPKESTDRGVTFDVGANVYGELGRALVIGTYGVSPALRHYLFHEVEGIHEDIHRLHRIHNPYLPDDVSDEVSWSPDCLIQVYRKGTGELETMYFCEIKAGNASFQRGQLEDMKTVAAKHNVLKIRASIERLPDEYTLKIEPVEPD